MCALSKAIHNMYFLLQRILDMDGAAQLHECIYIDEAGFNLSKNRRRGRNIIGQRAILHVPGQRGGNITLCAAMGYCTIIPKWVPIMRNT